MKLKSWNIGIVFKPQLNSMAFVTFKKYAIDDVNK